LTIEIPVGVQDELFKSVGDLTKGNFRSEFVKRVDL